MTASTDDVLAPLRLRIDAIDAAIVELLAKRMDCVGEVIGIKQAHGLPARIESRVEEVVANVRAGAEGVGAPPDLAETVYRSMIAWVIAHEERHLPPPVRLREGE
ncbi:chorismate mutase [Lichenihabitans sp. Uapishka_5]|uniref:chorismate mutase n=1 Tax=Lichenihabitans sp. Uapishka_5 TaxID=3037302 RepID=UPI0029E8124A|nr:chorismate mutase [Lichenihabitans sp. Uapishka_5]MDX7950974.1 chorismate mutase [Lichenihabitans sp. Uapishka_5]